MSPIIGIMASQISGHLFAASGAYDSIATIIGNGSSDTVTFTSIPQTYKHLQFRWTSKGSNGATDTNSMTWTANSDGTATNYYEHRLGFQNTNPNISQSNNANSVVNSVMNGATTQFVTGIFNIYDYTSTVKQKVGRGPMGANISSSGALYYNSFLWKNTAAITSISFQFAGNPFVAGTQFSLYGVK